MSQTILITGANGFVGRHVLQAIEEFHSNEEILLKIVVRKNYLKADFTYPENAEIIYTDDLFAENEQYLEKLCAGVSIIIHLAWFTEVGEFYTSCENLHCLTGTIKLAKACKKANVKRFIGIGSCAEYASSDLPLEISIRLEPQSLYAACKLSAYFTLLQYFELEKIEFAWCRLFYLYGDGEPKIKLHSYLHQQLAAGEIAKLGSGLAVLDYLEVNIAAKMIVEVALGNKQGAINICSGIGQKVRDIAEQIAREYGREDLLSFSKSEDDESKIVYVVGKV